MNLVCRLLLEKKNLSEKQIAFSTSSHFAEDIHQELIEVWLKKLDINESKLACGEDWPCLLYTSPSPRDAHESRMPSSA